MNRNTGWLGLTFCVLGMVLGQARADMVPIIVDHFGGSDGTQLVGSTPDTTNALGLGITYQGIYSIQSYTTSPYPVTNIQGNSGRVGADVGVALPISSYLASNPVPVLYLSAVLNPNTLNYNGDSTASNVIGLGLGFWETTQPVKSDGASGDNTGSHAPAGFSGLRLGQNASGGFLALFIGGSLAQADAYSGTWTAAAPHTLSYAVNLVTGNIENVVLDGTSYSFSPVTPDTGFNVPANLGYVGFDGSGTTIAQTGFVDDFVVAIPEPASLTLLTAAGCTVFFRRRR